MPRRILVIEDDILLSMDVEAILAESGFEVQVASSLAEAMRVVSERKTDCAVIDINLKGTMSFPAADALNDTGVPFLVLTGHSAHVIPPRHRARPFLQKPYKAAQLVEAVNGLIASIKHDASAPIPRSA
jgi:DNA-binding NtrC family response regulator